MRLLFWVLFLGFFLHSCDDGDIVVNNFDFEDSTLERCDNFDFVFFLINSDSNESLAAQFSTTENILTEQGQVEVTISSDDQVIYRRFNGAVTNDYFCDPIPPTSPSVVEELISTTGVITITTVGTEADGDGIPSDIEDPTGTLDTDDDGLLNIIDDDDDGDNVPTILEGVIFNDDGTIDIELSRDTDGDGILDYLDEDDDGDGVLTRNEDANGNLNPTDDSSDPLNPGVDDYLNSAIAVENLVNMYREHIYFLSDPVLTIDMEFLSFLDEAGEPAVTIQSSIFLGEFNAADATILTTPIFN